RSAVLQAILKKDYGSIQPLLSGQWQEGPEGCRLTHWRWRVEQVYGKPDKAARRLTTLADEAAREWHPLTGQVTQGDRSMRTTLAKLVLGPYYEAGAENKPKHVIVDVGRLRDHLADTKANPCYLPQLGNFKHIIFATPAVAPSDASIGDELRKCIAEASA